MNRRFRQFCHLLSHLLVGIGCLPGCSYEVDDPVAPSSTEGGYDTYDSNSASGSNGTNGTGDPYDPCGANQCCQEVVCNMSTPFCCPDSDHEASCVGGQVYISECEPGETCNAIMGCENCLDMCVAGDKRCGTSDIIEECQSTPNNQYCTDWVPIEDCSETNRSCQPPNFVCTNECGGTSILAHSVCDVVDQIPCGVYYCSGPNSLASDHVACREGGAECTNDNECASCNCGPDGRCQGNSIAHCVEANQCS